MAESLRLFNTLTRKVEPFVPLKPGEVGLYTCGPTVYSYAHIGNMRSYIFADVLRRSLELCGYQVKHVMNITDVGHLTDDGDHGEDKLEVGARREGLDAWAVAKKYTEAFFAHAGKVGIRPAQVVCKATDHVPEQIAMIRELEAKGYTYRTADGIYFDTSRFDAYVRLGRLDVEGLREGHRVDMGEKRQKTDFALWKFSTPEEKRQMEWESPWGRGFPGWHIECSAMSVKFLGPQFDIHTGGVDHIAIHHTNEIAQSECATGVSPFVRWWMHGEFLVIDDAVKMSKSTGNILTVDTLKERGFDPMAFRLLVLQTHYRKQLRFNFDILTGAQRGLARLRQHVARLLAGGEQPPPLTTAEAKATPHGREFLAAVTEDLNMPQAIAVLFGVLDDERESPRARLALLGWMDLVLGLEVFAPAEAQQDEVPKPLVELLSQRNAARAAKDFAAADRLRQEILAEGYEILDGPSGSSLRKRL